MEINRDTVSQWLITERRSQSWLAEKCGVSDQAVSNWLRENNFRPISSSAQITIRALMEEDAAKIEASARAPQNLVLEFDQEDFDNICMAAAAQGLLPRQWAQSQLAEIAELDVEAIAAKLSQKKA